MPSIGAPESSRGAQPRYLTGQTGRQADSQSDSWWYSYCKDGHMQGKDVICICDIYKIQQTWAFLLIV